MKALKWILISLAALLVAATAAVFIVLATYDFNALKPELTAAVKEATGRELAIEGDVDISISLSPSLVLEGVSFQNAAWGSRPQMVTMKRMELEVGLLALLSGDVEINRLILNEPDILIETDAQGRSNLDMEPVAKEAEPKKEAKSPSQAEGSGDQEREKDIREGQRHLVLNSVRIKDASLVVKNGQTLQTLDLKIKSFTARTENLNSTLRFSLEGTYNNDSFNLEGSSGSLDASLDPDVAWPLKLSGKFAGARMVVDGQIKDVSSGKGLDLKFKIASDEIEHLIAVMGGQPPLKGPLSIEGRLNNPDDRTVRLDDLNLESPAGDLKGWIFTQKGKTKIFNAELKSKLLDLRKLLAEPGKRTEKAHSGGPASQVRLAGEKDSASQKTDPQKVFSKTHLPFDKLRNFTIDLKLQAEQLFTPSLSAKKVNLAVKLDKGVLEIKPLTASVGGGKLNAKLRIAEAKKSGFIDLNLELKNCTLQTIMTELDLKDDPLAGKLNFDLNLKGSGKSVAQIMADLSGKTVLVLKNGKLHNKYVNFLGGDLKELLLEKLNPVSKSKDYTMLNCLVHGFDIKGGIAKISSLFVETDHMVISGGGKIDLRKETLDVGFEPDSKSSGGVIPTDLDVSLSQLVKPFTLSGTLKEPAIGLDVGKAITTIGKTAVGFTLFGPVGLAAAVLSQGKDAKDACKNAEHLARFGKLP